MMGTYSAKIAEEEGKPARRAPAKKGKKGGRVTPKGGRMTGLSDAQSAAQEALEEAGIEGVIGEAPLGTFRYLKVLKRRASRWCVVAVHALEVQVEHPVWQEQAERERVWVSRDEAVRRVDEPDLKALIAAFEG